ncbi:MAG: SCO family protein [Gallionellaceae bacterium]|nr:SCO family protein [Gallionellaceae bacterium]
MHATANLFQSPEENRLTSYFRYLLHALLACLAITALGGCKQQQQQQPAAAPLFKATDISIVDSGKDFRLTDHSGQQRTLSDFKGKVVVIFFGYTHCPEACPNTMVELARAMKQLGPDADNVQVLFVTLDPERDTQELMAQYVPAFHPKFIGLYGTTQQVIETAKEFKVFYNRVAGGSPSSYTIDHSLGAFIYDRTGKLRLLAGYGTGADAFAHDIKLLLQ